MHFLESLSLGLLGYSSTFRTVPLLYLFKGNSQGKAEPRKPDSAGEPPLFWVIICALACVPMSGGLRSTSGFMLQVLSTLPFEPGSLLSLELAKYPRPDGWPDPGLCLCLAGVGITSVHHHTWLLFFIFFFNVGFDEVFMLTRQALHPLGKLRRSRRPLLCKAPDIAAMMAR